MNKMLTTAAAVGLLAIAGTAHAQAVNVGGAVNGAVGSVSVSGATRDNAGVDRRDIERTVGVTPDRTASKATKQQRKRAQRADQEVDSHTRVHVREDDTPVGRVQTGPRAGGHVDSDPG